jgi:hypothetical protein
VRAPACLAGHASCRPLLNLYGCNSPQLAVGLFIERNEPTCPIHRHSVSNIARLGGAKHDLSHIRTIWAERGILLQPSHKQRGLHVWPIRAEGPRVCQRVAMAFSTSCSRNAGDCRGVSRLVTHRSLYLTQAREDAGLIAKCGIEQAGRAEGLRSGCYQPVPAKNQFIVRNDDIN